MPGLNDKCLFSLFGKLLPPEAEQLLDFAIDISAKSGVMVYFVGGTVRDLLLGKKVFDLDLLCEGDAISFGRQLSHLTGWGIVEHQKFGTCSLAPSYDVQRGFSDKVVNVDIATARVESYIEFGAYPCVKPSDSLSDLARRDFTINAMAMRIEKEKCGKIIDLFCGIRDLENGYIRVLHDRSFFDDPVRILRAVRFEQRLSFSIEPHTGKLIEQAVSAGVLEKLRRSRMADELKMIHRECCPKQCMYRLNFLLGRDFKKVLDVMKTAGICTDEQG